MCLSLTAAFTVSHSHVTLPLSPLVAASGAIARFGSEMKIESMVTSTEEDNGKERIRVLEEKVELFKTQAVQSQGCFHLPDILFPSVSLWPLSCW